MKTKIISFIFSMAFVMTNVHCRTDAGEVNLRPVLVRPDSPSLIPEGEEENQILPPPSNSSDTESSDYDYYDDSDDSDGEIFYGDYLSQNTFLDHNHDVPTSFDYCRERLATLFGRYEHEGLNSISLIEITPSVMHITINNERISVDYTVEFRSINGLNDSSIRFEIGEQTYRFELVIRYNTTYITGLMGIDTSLRKTQDYKATVTRIGHTVQIIGGIN